MMRGLRPIAIGLASLALLAGCETGVGLEPAAPVSGSDSVSRTTAGGIVFAAATPEWPGPVQIDAEVTPMRLSIRNESDRPVALKYEDLHLVLSNGTRYRALPLYRIDGEVQRPIRVRDFRPISAPGFLSSGFLIAPQYGGVYPGYAFYDRPLMFDRGFYDRYDTYYAGISLPTERMRTMALPEGVLNPGGRVDGWIYFERIPESFARATLHAELDDVASARPYAAFDIPFIATN